MSWNYFKDHEVAGLDNELVAMLDKARHRAGIPFVITDGLRAPGLSDPNAAQNSAHLTGNAVDIRCRDLPSLWKMLDGIFSSGFKRIGIYFTLAPNGHSTPTHIHVDNDLTKFQETVWLTVEK